MNFSFDVQPLGDSAITLKFSDRIDENINQYIINMSNHFRNADRRLIRDIVPCYATLTVHYYPEVVWRLCLDQETAFQYMSRWVRQAALTDAPIIEIPESVIRVPVCYSEKFGPDLKSLAKEKHLEIEEVIDLHTAGLYRVYMVGFLPGFAYMGILDERLSMERKAQPALHIPAGSVGIAGRQTGIYPIDSPGGWNIIGRTPLRLFDKDRWEPVFFAAGQKVSFFSITENEYKNY